MRSINYKFEAIGTLWTIDIYDVVSRSNEKHLLRQIQERIETFDKSYSRFRKDSFVNQMNQKKGHYTLPPDAKPMLDLYRGLYQLTNNLFSPLVGELLESAGYDSKYSLTPKKIKKPPEWNDVITRYSKEKITLKIPALFDFGAAGKGYLIDIIADLLTQKGFSSFSIDAGGDMLHKGKEKGLKIGLENPKNTRQVIGTVNIQNQSICGSSGNRRKWKRFHHIINTKTLASPDSILATWVVSEDTVLADALSTCLFLVLPDKLIHHYKFEYLILHDDFSITKSKGFYANFF